MKSHKLVVGIEGGVLKRFDSFVGKSGKGQLLLMLFLLMIAKAQPLP